MDPAAAIARAKRDKKINKTVSLLIFEWILIGLAIIVVYSFLGLQSIGTRIAMNVFFVGMFGVLFFALLVKIVMKTLGGKGRYIDSLTAVVYGNFAIAAGIFISSFLLSMQSAGFVLSFLVLAVSVALGISTFYRAVKELFNTDMITTWVGIGLTIAGFIVAAYILMSVSFSGLPSMMMGRSFFMG